MSFATVSFAQGGDIVRRGEKGVSSVGGIFGYAIDRKTAAVGVDFRYNIKDHVRLAPSVLHTLKSDYQSTWIVNADAHYLARITETATIYPLGGLGLSFWKTPRPIADPDAEYPADPDDEYPAERYETKTRLGLNLGFGGEMRITRDIILGAEFRYNLTTERIYDRAMILARAAYYF
jgi:opacity protein-like surface antigen